MPRYFVIVEMPSSYGCTVEAESQDKAEQIVRTNLQYNDAFRQDAIDCMVQDISSDLAEFSDIYTSETLEENDARYDTDNILTEDDA